MLSYLVSSSQISLKYFLDDHHHGQPGSVTGPSWSTGLCDEGDNEGGWMKKGKEEVFWGMGLESRKKKRQARADCVRPLGTH